KRRRTCRAVGSLLPFLRLDLLPDRHHANVAEQRVDNILILAAAVADMPDENDVDVIVRKNETADRGLCPYLSRDGAHALWKDRSENAAFARLDQLLIGDGLSCEHRRARNRARQLVHELDTAGLLGNVVA